MREECPYDFPPYRPPNEAASALIRITKGCPWNKCMFCFMYKSIPFKMKSLNEALKDIQRARQIYRDKEAIFLGDSDNLVHQDLPAIVASIRETFPEAKRITAYARAKTLVRKKMEFLVAVRRAGLNRLHIGLESGDAIVLERIRKGASPEEMVEAGRKAKKAGFEVSFYVLSGAGGKDRWKEHTMNSAAVLNEIGPDFIRLRTLTLQPGTSLQEKKIRGEFTITPPLERINEVKLFVEKLKVSNCYLASDHLTNYLWADKRIIYRGVAGILPDEKLAILNTLNRVISFIESTEMEIKDSNQLYEEGYITAL